MQNFTPFTTAQSFRVEGDSTNRHKSLSAPIFRAINPNGGDRYIPSRRGVNADVLHYYHTHEDEYKKDGVYIDVFQEIKKATEHWRRKYMESAFRQMNIFAGLRCSRVLNIGLAMEVKSKAAKMQEVCEEGIDWPCRPRKQPLISMKAENSKRYRDHGAQIFRFATTIRYKNLIDWSSRNTMAAGLGDFLCVCDVDFKDSKVYKIIYCSDLCCVKWDHAGKYLGICGVDGTISLYDADLTKIVWSGKCPCHKEGQKCKLNSIAWAKNDKNFINVCNEGCLAIRNVPKGDIIKSVNFDTEIRSLSISPKEQYLALSTVDGIVKILSYPSLDTLFEIVFFSCVKALAWHPWASGVLCIGGGPGDGSISLWNANNQRQLGIRKVHFIGSVDSLMFNKQNGELVVCWYYLAEDDRLHSKIAVLADLDHIVDAVPVKPEHRIINVCWNPDHSKLAMQHRDTLLIWNFFGNESHKWVFSKKNRKVVESKNKLRNYNHGLENFVRPNVSLKSSKYGKDFTYYNIR